MGAMKRSPLLSMLLRVFSLALIMPLFSLKNSANAHPAPQQQAETPMGTDERLDMPGWWPTKQSASRNDFVGTKECARCHAKIAATQTDTPMARAASLTGNGSWA